MNDPSDFTTGGDELDPVNPPPPPEGVTPDPPKRRRESRAASSTGGRPTTGEKVHGDRARRVAAAYRSMGAGLAFASVFGSAQLGAVGVAMEDNADQLGEAWATWADTSARVARMIDGAAFGGAGMAVLVAHLPLVKAVMGDGASLLDLFGPGAPDDLSGLAAE